MSSTGSWMSHRLTIATASRLLSSHRLSSEELSRYCYQLACIGEREWDLNAFTHLLSLDDILKQAHESDTRTRRNRRLSALDGIPVTIKANIAVRGAKLTAASKILGESGKRQSDLYEETGTNDCHCCWGYDSDVTHRLLREAGAILIGITNMDEFGMGSLGNNCPPYSSSRMDDDLDENNNHDIENTNENGKRLKGEKSFTRNPLPYMQRMLHLKRTQISTDICRHDVDSFWVQRIQTPTNELIEQHSILNPNDLNNMTYSAGGSSCGSAASVSHGSSLASVGTDTGGSIRLPSSWCGLVGLKPTYGLISRYGVVAYASSLDTVGIITPTAHCASLVLDCLANRNEVGTTAANTTDNNYENKKERAGFTCRDSTSVFYSPSISVSSHLTKNSNDDNDREVSSSSSFNMDSPSTSPASHNNTLSGMRVGIPAAFSVTECPDYIEHAWLNAAELLQNDNAEIVTIPSDIISPSIIQNSLAAYYVLACAEASSNLSRYDGIRYGMQFHNDLFDDESLLLSKAKEDETNERNALFSNLTPLEQQISSTRVHGFGDEVIRRVLCGTSVLSSDRFHTYYEAAARLRAVVCREFRNAFDKGGNDDGTAQDGKGVDLILVPTALSLPPRLGSGRGEDARLDSTEMFANDVMTVPISLAGLPSVSVPVQIVPTSAAVDDQRSGVTNGSENYPWNVVGMQIVGPRLAEADVLRAAHVIEIGQKTV